jgi:tRNA(Ser,Leu) C12 N-acetylase TAN1
MTSPQEERGHPGKIKLIVTAKDLFSAKYTKASLKEALDRARVAQTGFKGVFAVEVEGRVEEILETIQRECGEDIGRVTPVMKEIPSRTEALKEAAVELAREAIGPDETFCFRIHKRGSHGYSEDTPVLEREIGGAIFDALEKRDGKPPKVRLASPDVTVVAEVMGEWTAVGVIKKSWLKEA